MGGVGLLVKGIMMPPSATPDQVMAVGRLASRSGIASILILFVIGGVLFYFVDEDRGKEEAAKLT
jgi:UMF1 family MFS transporter